MKERPGILTTLEEGVLLVELDRPDRRNALDESNEARERLRHIFMRAPQAYGLSKRLLHVSASVDLESGLFVESLAQSLLVGTEDHKEGVRAARERRRPSFAGR
jgi:enoyl-CoA hydratase/carnithine racemase